MRTCVLKRILRAQPRDNLISRLMSIWIMDLKDHLSRSQTILSKTGQEWYPVFPVMQISSGLSLPPQSQSEKDCGAEWFQKVRMPLQFRWSRRSLSRALPQQSCSRGRATADRQHGMNSTPLSHGVILLPQWDQRAEPWAKEDYSWASRLNVIDRLGFEFEITSP